MTPEREREIRAWLDDEPSCSYVGRCNSSRCPKHSPERRAARDLFNEVERLRAVNDRMSKTIDLLTADRDHTRDMAHKAIGRAVAETQATRAAYDRVTWALESSYPLPVITSCGTCGWSRGHDDAPGEHIGRCAKPGPGARYHAARDIYTDKAPPAWCPLRKAAARARDERGGPLDTLLDKVGER